MKNMNFDHLGQGPIIGNEPEIRIDKKKILKNKPKKLFAMENFSSFFENEENIEKEKIIRKGLNIDEFWNNFIKICGDSNALSKLLNVPKEKISSWSAAIQNGIQEINKKDKSVPNFHKKLI